MVVIENGYIIGVCKSSQDTFADVEEAKRVFEAIKNKPQTDKDCMLKADYTWEILD